MQKRSAWAEVEMNEHVVSFPPKADADECHCVTMENTHQRVISIP